MYVLKISRVGAAAETDLDAMRCIDRHHVLPSEGTVEIASSNVAPMRRRWKNALPRGAGMGPMRADPLRQASAQPGGWQRLAVIGGKVNWVLIAVDERYRLPHQGVTTVGGMGFGRWLDVVRMQRSLVPGAGTAPCFA